MRRALKLVSRCALGVLALIFGIIGVLVPLIPGTPFLLGGVALFSPRLRGKMIRWAEDTYKKFKQWKTH